MMVNFARGSLVVLVLVLSLPFSSALASEIHSSDTPESSSELSGPKKEVRLLRKEIKKLEKEFSELKKTKEKLDEEENELTKKAWAQAAKRKNRRNTHKIRHHEQKILDQLSTKRLEITELSGLISHNQSQISTFNARIAHLSGYELVKNTTPKKPLPKRELDKPEYSLKKEARNWIGTPYRFGGNSKSGIDCSGLTSQLYNTLYQINLPRTSAGQFDQSNKISKSRLKPGDLVFFRVRKSQVDHVGIYIGNNEFIHSSSSKGVIISNLDDSYYRKHFVGGGRYNL